jgi:N-acetylglucosamine-6-sulfatase
MKAAGIVLLLVVLLAIPSSAAAQRPNVVFILVDDLRWDEIGAAGHPYARTPHIDRLAREGAQFRNAYATTPLCSPSRASFLTGKYARTHGITDNVDRSAASHRLVTFPQVLQRAGYDSAFIGKWHMGNDDSPRPGFDYWVSFKGQGQYLDPEITEGGRTGVVRGYITDILNQRAVEFVRQKRSKPFVLYLAHKAVHPNIRQRDDGSVEPIGGEMFVPAERHRGLYAGARPPRRQNFGKPPLDKPALMRRIGDLPALGPATATDDATILGRQRALAAVDDGVGKILEALEATGALENTIVMFAGDHGYFYGEHGLNDERRLAYEESARIPLLVRYPKIAAAKSAPTQFALNIDVAPTVLELAGVPGSADVDGRSLVPLLRGARPTDWRTSFVIEYFSDRVFPRILNMGYQAVRTERWKYIRYSELANMDELYDLTADPYEMKNAIADPARKEDLRRLQDELNRLLRERSTQASR